MLSKNLPFFWKTTPLRENFENFVPKGFITSQIHVFCVNLVIHGRLEIGKVVRYLPDKKKQNFGSLSRSRLCADRAQNLPGQRQTMYSKCLKLHPNRFTFGGVIAEHVNTVQTRHKVFPILGEATAFSPSKKETVALYNGLGSLYSEGGRA